MNDQDKYSDEYINAYIDGELDNDERARLLFDEQENTALAQRINNTRMLKEKIQLAYSNINDTKAETTPFSCSTFASHHRKLVASLLLFTALSAMLVFNLRTNNDNLLLAKQLIENTQPISTNAIDSTIGIHKRVVINISQYNAQNFDDTINTLETLLLDRSDDKLFNLELVADGQGLKALDTETSVHANRINQLANQFNNLEVIACAKSLTKLANDGNPIQLMKSIILTPSAAQQVAKRTGEGWLYLKI